MCFGAGTLAGACPVGMRHPSSGKTISILAGAPASSGRSHGRGSAARRRRLLPSNRDSRPSSLTVCRPEGKGYMLPEFYSSATGLPGRFTGGLLLRRWCALARHARTIWQLELGLRALFALERGRGLGCGVRNAGFSRAPGRRGTCHRFHERAGAPTCSRRKRGTQKQEALGRSRGGFSTKFHLRTNANGEPPGAGPCWRSYRSEIIRRISF
jgi:hypothetical protein